MSGAIVKSDEMEVGMLLMGHSLTESFYETMSSSGEKVVVRNKAHNSFNGSIWKIKALLLPFILLEVEWHGAGMSKGYQSTADTRHCKFMKVTQEFLEATQR